MKIHRPFPDDLEGVVELFDRPEIRANHDSAWEGNYICCPKSLAMNELVRRKHLKAGELKPTAPCAIYLFGRWDGETPFGTRIGGLPARDHSRPWPVSSEGAPLMFIAQMDFDGVAGLPCGVKAGSILSVFAEVLSGYQDMNLQFEWQSRESSTLTKKEQIPSGVEVLPAFQGKPFEATDYIPIDPARFDPDRSEKYIPALWGTKIGGVNPVHERILASRNWGKPPEQHVTSLGQFLGTIGCIQPSVDLPWPYIDREEPMAWPEFFQAARMEGSSSPTWE
jgi:hypothetical protein